MDMIPGTDNDSSTADANGGPTLSNKVVDTQEFRERAAQLLLTISTRDVGLLAERVRRGLADDHPFLAALRTTQCSGDTQLADEIIAAAKKHESIIIEPMGDGLGWASTDTGTEDRVWHPLPALRTTHSPSEAEASARNVYRLQMGGVRLCDALRRIANGCEGRIDKDSIPALIAAKALAHNEPDPKDWNAALSLPSDKTVELLREIKSKVAYHVENPSAWDTFDQGVSDLLGGIVKSIDSHLGEMK